MMRLRRVLPHSRRIIVVVGVAVILVLLMFKAGLSPLQFVSLSTLTTAVVLVLQGFIQNIVAGVTVAIQGRFPVGSVLTVEGMTGTVKHHSALYLELISPSGASVDCPYIKLLNDIVLHGPKPPAA